MPFYLGLDCGGSTSRALVVDDSAEIVFARTAGPANLVSTPMHRLRRNLAKAAEGAPAPAAVCGCFAGLIDETTRTTAIELLRELFPQARLRAEPDCYAAFRSFEPETPDILVIAGTGSLVCSVVEGEIRRSGGRGYLLGDAGAAFQYGRDALNAYLDDPESASEPLRRAVRDVFGDASSSQIIIRIYEGSVPSLLAKLAPALASDAQKGLEYATESLAKNTDELAKSVSRHAERYLSDRRIVAVGLSGGLWNTSLIYRNAAFAAFQRAMPNRDVHFVTTHRPPVHGAVILAKELMNGN
jgi:N-acetylglucosamine kinase-like BadF-type ATPase